MDLLPYYSITLPMPPSVNAMHSVGAGRVNKKTGKKIRCVYRSDEYNDWIQRAGLVWRTEYGYRGLSQLTGRLAAHYIFIWNEADRAHLSSDVNNREKCLTDFLEKKFFDNDKAIDESHHYRRITNVGQNRVICRIYATPDRRFDSPDKIFTL